MNSEPAELVCAGGTPMAGGRAGVLEPCPPSSRWCATGATSRSARPCGATAIPEPQASQCPSCRVPAPFLLKLASLLWGLERPPSTALGRTQPRGRLQAPCLRAWGCAPPVGLLGTPESRHL